MLNSDHLAEMLAVRFRLALKGEVRRVSEGNFACIRATDVPSPNGFVVQVTPGWRSVDARFVPDGFAGELIRAMGLADDGARQSFSRAAYAFAKTGARISLRINQSTISAFEILPVPPWTGFELVLHRMSVVGEESANRLLVEAVEVASMCLALVLFLLPVEEDATASMPLFELGLPEGAKSRVEVNRYERSPVNRATCLATHGTSCGACGMDFGSTYGPLGAGYIEVHHLIPVSKMGADYRVDPVRDLVPLCANCHAMVHRCDPPLAVEDLKVMLAS